MIAFGVGCFHFAPRMVPRQRLKASDYIKNIKTTLEGIKSISDININLRLQADVQETYIELDKEKSLPNIAEGEICFPIFPRFSLEFKIHIPFRVQKDLLKPFKDYYKTSTESFMYYTQYTFFGPVVFIQCIGAKNDAFPSDSVILLRLGDYISRPSGTLLYFFVTNLLRVF